MRVIVITLIAVCCVSFGEALLSKAMKEVGPIDRLSLPLISRIASNGHLWVGIFLMAVFFVLYSIALSWADLSYVLPLTAISYLTGAFLAKYYLHEDVTLVRWIGATVITIGVIIVGRGG